MIYLWEKDIPGYDRALSEQVPYLVPFLLTRQKKNALIIVCPGGGYHHLALHEGAPVAQWLNQIGISAAVLNYRLAPYQHPYPLLDLQRAIRYIRYHAVEWEIDPDKVGVLGFSAGGHLAATAGTHFDSGDSTAEDPVEQMSSRPNLMILCYPVITFGDFCHSGSKERLLGKTPPTSLVKLLSAEQNVTTETPPTFLWHTADDASVPVENSLMMAGSLSKYRIPFEMHIFPKGKHGLGLAPGQPEVGVWKDLCKNWLKGQGFLE